MWQRRSMSFVGRFTDSLPVRTGSRFPRWWVRGSWVAALTIFATCCAPPCEARQQPVPAPNLPIRVLLVKHGIEYDIDKRNNRTDYIYRFEYMESDGSIESDRVRLGSYGPPVPKTTEDHPKSTSEVLAETWEADRAFPELERAYKPALRPLLDAGRKHIESKSEYWYRRSAPAQKATERPAPLKAGSFRVRHEGSRRSELRVLAYQDLLGFWNHGGKLSTMLIPGQARQLNLPAETSVHALTYVLVSPNGRFTGPWWLTAGSETSSVTVTDEFLPALECVAGTIGGPAPAPCTWSYEYTTSNIDHALVVRMRTSDAPKGLRMDLVNESGTGIGKSRVSSQGDWVSVVQLTDHCRLRVEVSAADEWEVAKHPTKFQIEFRIVPHDLLARECADEAMSQFAADHLLKLAAAVALGDEPTPSQVVWPLVETGVGITASLVGASRGLQIVSDEVDMDWEHEAGDRFGALLRAAGEWSAPEIQVALCFVQALDAGIKAEIRDSRRLKPEFTVAKSASSKSK
jgi:hypothetical protein